MQIQNIPSGVSIPQSARVASESTPVAEVAQAAAASPAAAAQQQAAPPVSAAQLQSAVQSANQTMADSNKNLSFSVDSDTKQTIVKLTDSKTGALIGQFPSHQMLEISKAIGLMQEQLQQATLTKVPAQSTQGMLIKQQA